jgi:hypothetical protein
MLDHITLPFYKQTRGFGMFYQYDGTYRITRVEEMQGKPVLDFLTRRGDSRQAKTSAIWEDKANATWLKVTIQRVAHEEQQEDPVVIAQRQAGKLDG